MQKNCYRFAMIMALALALIIGQSVSAGEKFSYDGQIRLRGELDLKSTAESRHSANFYDLRTRIGFKFQPVDLAYVYVQLQDSRRLGDPASGDLSSTDNVDIHQAYFQLSDFVTKGLSLKAGRFEHVYGNQRIFGSVGWSNTGRSWEGGLLSYKHEKFWIDLFGLKKMELNSKNYNQDFDIFGLYGKCEKSNLEFFAFYELNSDSGFSVFDTDDDSWDHSNAYKQAKLKRWNFGGYYTREYRDFDFVLQGAYQMGQIMEIPRYRDNETDLPDSLRGPGDHAVLDIAAFMVATEVGYNFSCKANPRLAIGVDYSSGDNYSDTTKYKAFANEYYTGHKFRGFMDYFVKDSFLDGDARATRRPGLIDAVFRAKANIRSKCVLKADFHYLQTAEKYVSKSDATTLTSKVGMEFDLTLVSKAIQGATITAGTSFFIADKDFAKAGDNRKTGIWAYLMTTVNF